MPKPIPKTSPATLKKIIQVLRKGKTFCLSGHQNPDADVIGSQLAMASLIRRLGNNKKVIIQNNGAPPKNLSFLKGFKKIKNVKKAKGTYDVVIVFECSGMDRMGNIVDFHTQAKHVVNLDHHLHNPYYGTINLVEPTTSSTAELIFKIFKASGLKMNRDEAVSIYVGMVADTGWFRYGNTNTQTLDIAAQLMKVGLPISDISENLYLSRSRASVKILASVLSNLSLYFKNRVSVLKVSKSFFDRVGATGDDLDEIVNAGLALKSAQASVLIKEKIKGKLVKVSLRSKGQWDINRVARVFGGGGHKNASGCSIDSSVNVAEKKLLKELKKVFS